MILLLGQLILIIILGDLQVSTNDKFLINYDNVTWREFISWPQMEGPNHNFEQAWVNRLRRDDYVEESEVASYQKDVRSCREHLSNYSTQTSGDEYEYCTTWYEHRHRNIPHAAGRFEWAFCGPNSKPRTWIEKQVFLLKTSFETWMYIKLPRRLRITGLRVTQDNPKVLHPYVGAPYWPGFKTHVTLAYRLYDTDSLEKFMVDGNERIFKIPQYDAEDDEGFGTLTLDPDIVANLVHIDMKHWRGHGRNAFHLLGCQDDIGMQNYQFSNVNSSVSAILASDVTNSVMRLLFKFWLRSIRPSYEDGCAIFDFEDGDITGWEAEGNAFANQPTYGDNKFHRERQDATGFLGNWWVSSYDQHPFPMSVRSTTSVRRTGTLTSPTFAISTPKISFLMGGGDQQGSVGVELIIFRQVVASAYLSHEEATMKRHVFDVSSHLTKPATLKLVDQSTTSYLMFDDLRTVERCGDECSRPVGMEGGEILDDHITSSTGTASGYPAKNVRFSTTLDSVDYFKVAQSAPPDGITIFRSWLQIKFVHMTVVDGWATQSVTQMEGRCGLESYYVMYCQNNAAWRYLSLRNWRHNNDTRIIYHHDESITRHYLNPRVNALQLRFVLVKSNAEASYSHFCFRLEIYGCSLYSASADSKPPEIKTRLLTQKDRSRRARDTYKLSLLNIPVGVIAQGNILLTCVSTSSILHDLSDKYEWNELIFNSLVALTGETNEIRVPLQASFYKRIFRCQIFHGKDKPKVLFTREFILIESSKKLVVPFVTAEASADIRGGRLVVGDTAVFPIEGQNQFFVSLNLANIIHPYVMTQPWLLYCPQEIWTHSPFKGYKRYGQVHSIRDPMRCFDLAIRDGARAMSIKDFSCYGGPEVTSWFEVRPSYRDVKHYYYFRQDTCEDIWSYYDKEAGAKCKKSCLKARDWMFTYDNYGANSQVPPVQHSQHLYKLNYMSDYKWLTIKVSVDGRNVFSKRFDIEEVMAGPPEFLRPVYNSGLFPRSRYVGEDSVFHTEHPGVKYHDCEGRDTADNVLRYGRCATYVSTYGSSPYGTGSLITFLYLFRDSYKFTYKRVLIHGQYKHKDGWVKSYSQYIDVRHLASPTIQMNSTIGVCHMEYKEIVPVVRINDTGFNAWRMLKYSWKSITREESQFDTEEKEAVPLRLTSDNFLYQHKEKLILFEALEEHSGAYEFSVESPFGNVTARTHVTVYRNYPRITWVTRSPHTVIEGSSDILQIRTNTDVYVKAILWYHEDTLIEPSNHFTFIDGGSLPQQRKRLLLKNIGDAPLSGMYYVHLIGDYCSFKRSIRVTINVKPLVSITPNTGHRNYVEKNEGDRVVFTAAVIGGTPAVRSSSMYWKKNSYRLRSVPGSRLIVQKVRVSRNKWISTLTIDNLERADEATYTFFATAGNAEARAVKVLYVSDADGNSGRAQVGALRTSEGSTAFLAPCHVYLVFVAFCSYCLYSYI